MTTYQEILNHYSKEVVRKEISDFVKGRWVALEGSIKGNRMFIRYLRDKPLTIKSPEEVTSLIRRYRGIGVRTVYATVNVYDDLSSPQVLDDLRNVVRTTPFWDIDTELSRWEYAVRAAEVLSEYIESWGVRKSLYVMWSGEGMHVRISEKAFSTELIESNHPLDVAFAVVEFVLKEVRDRLMKLISESGGVLKVENLIDAKRVFTSPLSLHRRLNLVAVCMKPDDLSSFNPSWTDMHDFKHRSVWREYDEGEADDLARKALQAIGKVKSVGLSVKSTRVGGFIGKRNALSRKPVKSGRIGRFEVMALLQAARYYLLTGDLSKAMSFGLNRAIFYAWAKHYGRSYAARRGFTAGSEATPKGIRWKLVKVAGEEVPQSTNGWFMIGDKEQLPEDFLKNVVRKIEPVVPYDLAWESALKYVSSFPKDVVADQRLFFEKIYKPVRDAFIQKVIEGSFREEKQVKEVSHEAREGKPKDLREVRGRGGSPKRKTLLDWMRKD